MTGISMAGLDWAAGPETGIYLMPKDTTEAEVRRGGGGMLGSKKLKGWSGGRFVPGDVKTSEEALKLTGLDWEVDRRPILKVEPIMGVPTEDNPSGILGWEPVKTDATSVERGKRKQVNDLPTGGYDIAEAHVQNVRRDTGKVLGVVGPGWRSPRNREAFTFLDDLVDSNDAKWLGGGEIDGGKRIWLACQFNRDVLIGGDENERSIPLGFISNGWDGTLALSITVAPYRLACLNGQSIPLEGYVRTWKARHTAGLRADMRLAEARRTLELSIGYFDAWTESMNELITKKISRPALTKMLERLIPEPTVIVGKPAGQRAIENAKQKRADILAIYNDEDNLQHLGHTAYRALNAVTQYADWSLAGTAEKQILRSAEPSKMKDLAFALLA